MKRFKVLLTLIFVFSLVLKMGIAYGQYTHKKILAIEYCSEPYKYIGFIGCKEKDENGNWKIRKFGTATLIGKNHILTATHVLTNKTVYRKIRNGEAIFWLPSGEHRTLKTDRKKGKAKYPIPFVTKDISLAAADEADFLTELKKKKGKMNKKHFSVAYDKFMVNSLKKGNYLIHEGAGYDIAVAELYNKPPEWGGNAIISNGEKPLGEDGYAKWDEFRLKKGQTQEVYAAGYDSFKEEFDIYFNGPKKKGWKIPHKKFETCTILPMFLRPKKYPMVDPNVRLYRRSGEIDYLDYREYAYKWSNISFDLFWMKPVQNFIQNDKPKLHKLIKELVPESKDSGFLCNFTARGGASGGPIWIKGPNDNPIIIGVINGFNPHRKGISTNFNGTTVTCITSKSKGTINKFLKGILVRKRN